MRADRQDQPGTVSIEAWEALDEDDTSELVDGQLVEAEMPGWVHETVVRWLMVKLDRWVQSRGGWLAPSGIKYALSARSGRMPDASVFLGRRPPAQGVVRLPPDVAIEVVSPTPRDARRDRIEKLQEYARFGVRWYWIVDPELRSLEVFELRDGAFAHARAGVSGVVSDIPGCPELSLDLDALWAELDRLIEPAAD